MSFFNTFRAGFVALLLAACSLAVSACGGEDVNTLIDKTFSGKGGKEVRSGKMALDLSVKTQGGPPQLSEPVALKVSGPFQSQGKGKLPLFDLALSIAASGQSFSAGLTLTDKQGYVKVQGTSYELPPGTYARLQQLAKEAQQKADAERKQQEGSSPLTLGVNPGNWLVQARTVGDEEVAGADTTHVTARIDVHKMVADVNKALKSARSQGLPQSQQLPPAITPAQEKQITDAVKNPTLDFWTGKDDDLLRKLSIKLDFVIPAAERTRAQGITGGGVTFTFQRSELNEPQRIAAPANARPFSELAPSLGGLGGLLSGAGGGGAGGPGTSGAGTPGAGASGPSDEYVRCVQQAGGDVAKAQQCARLLNR